MDIHIIMMIAVILVGGRMVNCQNFEVIDGGEDEDILSKECGKTITGENNGKITSPGFPEAYPAVSRCNFTIIAPKDHLVEYTSLYMDLEERDISEDLCLYDSVRIYDGDEITSSYCGKEKIFPNVTTTNRLTILFLSDYTTEATGFEIEWKIVNPTTRKNSLDCNFDEAIPLCAGWINENQNYPWLFSREYTPSANTGPISDHTSLETGEKGRYAYIEASSSGAGTTAILQSPPIISRGISDQRCLKFWYHMFGDGMGTLSVYLMNGAEDNTTLGSYSGDLGDVWNEGEYTITLQSLMSTIIFEGKRGSSYKSDMALDDITITEGACGSVGPERTLTGTNVEPPTGGGSSLIPIDCPDNLKPRTCEECKLTCDTLDDLGTTLFCTQACFDNCSCSIDFPVFDGGRCVAFEDCIIEVTSTATQAEESTVAADESTAPAVTNMVTHSVKTKYGKKEEIHDDIIRRVLDAVAAVMLKLSNT